MLGYLLMGRDMGIGTICMDEKVSCSDEEASDDGMGKEQPSSDDPFLYKELSISCRKPKRKTIAIRNNMLMKRGAGERAEGVIEVSSIAKGDGGTLFNDFEKFIQMGQIRGLEIDGTSIDFEKFVTRMSENMVDH
ncbi:hypothetical protein L1987_14948 [Smallanthus sonchifolius]|uniref:Uncharacterized protein n=1 Tax=Smallanthus sonchifolius TaxID=185202 RepID=A0ACB9J586_9ASTR|nr:hypothetical protein L1987_14948 [Smallanthus sonchifolius]